MPTNHRCVQCVLPSSYPDVSLTPEGKCNYCASKSHVASHDGASNISEADRQKYEQKFHRIIDELRTRDIPYHGVLALSGGKDSIYLYHYLTEVCGLRIKAIFVDMGFDSDAAMENITRLKSEFQWDIEVLKYPHEFLVKFYRFLLQKALDVQANSNFTDFVKTVCGVCHPLLNLSVYQRAYQLKVPFVFAGQSPDESNTYQFTMPRWLIKLIPAPKIIKKSELFTEEEKGYFWHGPKHLFHKIPRFVGPLHALPYHADTIRQELHDLGLITLENSSSAKTNCKILNFMFSVALKDGKPLPYLYHIAELVRTDKLSRGSALGMLEEMVHQCHSVAEEVRGRLSI